MKELIDCIKENTTAKTQEIQASICGMICSPSDPIELSKETLLDALKIDGEFLVLKLHFNDFEEELKNQIIKYKISQALSVIISYEDDGNSYDQVKQFIEYIHNISDDKQNSIFGIKNVDKLSEAPITILFSGILPINQLKMYVGKTIDNLIHSDDEFFIPKFSEYRTKISQEIGIPILPLFPQLDNKLGDLQVRLIDLTNGELISEFEVAKTLSKDTIDIYLLKLFYIYKVLAEDKKCNK